MSSDIPSTSRKRYTNFMKDVELNKVRDYMLNGWTQQQIAHELKRTTRQVRRYVRTIKEQDYQALIQTDAATRAHIMRMSIAEATRLKMEMLHIVTSEKATNQDRILAAREARQFNMDIVNLSLNGPAVVIGKRYISGARAQETNSISLPEPRGGDSGATNGGGDTG